MTRTSRTGSGEKRLSLRGGCEAADEAISKRLLRSPIENDGSLAMTPVAIVAINNNGKKTALRIKRCLPNSEIYIANGNLNGLTKKLFSEYKGIIFCMSLGIVVRAIAPYIRNKYTDPAVVAVDSGMRFAISVLSGHEGGANNLAIYTATILGAEPIITTASQSQKNIVIGIGCRKGVKKNEVIGAIRAALSKAKSLIGKIRCAATIDLKQDEPGLKQACLDLGIPLRLFTRKLIKNYNGPYQRSSFVKAKIGIEGVSEPCAILAAKNAKLILPKTKIGRVTVAVCREGLQ